MTDEPEVYEITWYPNINDHRHRWWDLVDKDSETRGLKPVAIINIDSVGEQPGDPAGWLIRYTATHQ